MSGTPVCERDGEERLKFNQLVCRQINCLERGPDVGPTKLVIVKKGQGSSSILWKSVCV